MFWGKVDGIGEAFIEEVMLKLSGLRGSQILLNGESWCENPNEMR